MPKIGPNAGKTDSENPILCANSVADMLLFKDVVNSQYAKFLAFNKAEKAVATVLKGGANCDSGPLIFFKRQIVRSLAFAQKRFNYFTGGNRKPLKDTSESYVQDILEMTFGNISSLFGIELKDVFSECSAKLTTEAAEEATKIEGYKRLSFLQKTSTSK